MCTTKTWFMIGFTINHNPLGCIRSFFTNRTFWIHWNKKWQYNPLSL